MTELVPRDVAALSPIASGGALSRAADGLYWTEDTEVWWSEAGRIRLGYSTPGRSGRGKIPHKLDRFRLTSPRRDLIEAAAALYGGEVTTWPKEEAPFGIEQAQVVVEAPWLDVMVPEHRAGGSAYELWEQPDRKGPVVRTRLCTGEWETITKQPCRCLAEGVFEAAAEGEDDGELVADAPTVRACKRITRLSLILTRLGDLGVWRLETGGKTGGNQLLTFMRFWLPRMEPYARLQLGITAEPRRRKDDSDRWQVVLVNVPVLRSDPATGKTAGDLLTGASDSSAAVPAAVAEVASRAAARQAGGAPPGPADTVPPDGAGGPGPGDPDEATQDWPAGAPQAEPHGLGDAADDEVPADPSPAGPARSPGISVDSPVLAWARARGLMPGACRRFLVTRHPSAFGRDSAHMLRNDNNLAALDGELAAEAIALLAAAPAVAFCDARRLELVTAARALWNHHPADFGRGAPHQMSGADSLLLLEEEVARVAAELLAELFDEGGEPRGWAGDG